jgi:predicted RNA-binding Zn ribbon-like protein
MVAAGASAPGELELVRAFVNTLDVESGEDALSSPDAFVSWLAAHGLLEPDGRVSRSQLARAIAVREALRALLVENTGGPHDPDAPALLDAAAREARLSLRFDAAGRSVLDPGAAGVAAAMGRLLAIVAEAMAAGNWSRLKACRDESCRWAFYDRARNRSRTWCSMAVCGNRRKARRFRARHST